MSDKVLRVLIIGQSNASSYTTRSLRKEYRRADTNVLYLTNQNHKYEPFSMKTASKSMDTYYEADKENLQDFGSFYDMVGIIVDYSLYNVAKVANISYGGTTIGEWATEQRFEDRLQYAKDSLDAGSEFDLCLMEIGESDAVEGNSKQEYIDNFNDFMANRYNPKFPNTPLLLNKFTYVFGSGNTKIRSAIDEVCNTHDNIFLGVDGDVLGEKYRRPDNIHFNDKGSEYLIYNMFDTIRYDVKIRGF